MADSVAAHLLPGMGVQQLPKRIPSARMTYRTLLASPAYTPRLVVCYRAIFSRVTLPSSLPLPRSLTTAAAWLGHSPPASFRAGLRSHDPGRKAVTPRSLPGVWPPALLL